MNKSTRENLQNFLSKQKLLGNLEGPLGLSINIKSKSFFISDSIKDYIYDWH